jgi:hypothetical protein
MEVVRQEKALTMGWCLECHRNPEPHLRPRERVVDLAWTPETDARALGREIKERYDVTPSTDCTACHR